MADLNVRVIGDARQYERTLKKTETATKRWARNMETVTGSKAGGLFGLGKGGAALAGAGAAVLALKKINDAARESQLVAGQTSVAVENAGLSWAQYGTQVQDASQKISKASSFDDEAVMKSFSVFIRGNRNVAKSLDLAQLSADVARGRYTDLESATQLVNKAAMGQVGALRRAGIQIDKNATSTEALTLLNEKFSGSAEEFSKSAVGQSERLRVSWENLLEDLGANTSNTVGQTQSALASLVDTLDGLVKKNDEVQQSWQRMVGGIKESAPDFTAGAEAFDDLFGLGRLTRTKKRPAAFGEPGFRPGGGAPVPPGPSVELRNQWFDAIVGRKVDRVRDITTLQGQVAALGKIAALIRQRIKATGDVTRQLGLEDDLLQVTRQAQDTRDRIAADAADAARQASENRLGWIDFALEKADDTKTKTDNLKALRDREAFFKELIRSEGKTLENVRELWRTRKQIRDLGKAAAGDGDPLAGLMQVSSKRLTNILAAGTGLSGAGRRALSANIAGAEIQPLYVSVQIDGREIGRAVSNDQARTSARAPKQTSGHRG